MLHLLSCCCLATNLKDAGKRSTRFSLLSQYERQNEQMCLANENGGTVCENLVILTYKVHDMMLWLRAAETWRFKERLLKYLSHTQKMWQSVHNKVSRLENSNKM